VSARPRLPVVLAGLALVLAAACRPEAPAPASSAGGAPDAAAPGAAQRKAPPPTKTTAQELVALAGDGKASVTVVNVWATWCVPCRQEMPDLVRLGREMAGDGVRLVLVSTDFDESPEHIAEVLTGYGVDFPTYLKEQRDVDFIDGLDPDWQGAIPATFVYDRSGRLQQFLLGRQDHDALVRAVRGVLHG